MKILRHSDPGYASFIKRLNRRAIPDPGVRELVGEIISEVAANGDGALLAYTKRFDGATLTAKELFVSEEEFAAAEKAVTPATRRAIARSLKNIKAFAKHSLRKDWSYKNAEGATVGERFTPFDRVGVYVPGGKAPLVSTALMTAGFALAAGVPEIIGATPCGPDGKVNPAVLYALRKSGATEVIKVGGAQAVAALALGTKSIRPVDMIVGPGNRFVVEAKRQLVGAVAIDLLPGPSEVLILSDKTGNPEFIAADLLAQAEHAGDSVVGFLTDSKALLDKVLKAVDRQILTLSRNKYIRDVLKGGTFVLHVKSMDEGIAIVNDFAPEHLSLICADEKKRLAQVRTAGAIYVGNDSPVAVGDFLAGPSHTLPTGGAGRSFSGLRADHFQRRTSIVKLDKAAVRKSLDVVEEFARIEGLDAHGRSTAIRLEHR
ncbi:histidinol dehydrogenase [Luteolibacter ambystomatis]|uniref:Histidinol dehydrogenase n=1 Tax=Luteolibacter ambystomatis TaxID=2824561 RepID=A0A975J147_9BACT|nr:histidinol dehydrogenase [Luteolibacter ambystomatis]QUE52067.1 histidinol dehydrogenase [Luteolibacter ambystomatis]